MLLLKNMPYLIKLIKKTFGMAHPAERRVVMSNVASLTSLQAITYVLPVIIMPYLFRIIGPEKFGLIAFAQAFVQYFAIITDYGFGISATKEISLCREEHRKVSCVFSSVITVKILLAVLSLLALGLLVYFVPKFRRDWPVYLLSFGAVAGNTLFPVWFFQGTEKMRHIADLNILAGVILALLIFTCVRTPQDYLLVPLINSGVMMITGVLGLYIVFKKFGVSFKFPGYADIRSQLQAGWDIFISNVAINAYTTTRVFAVGLLTNNTATGFYSMAEKIANAVQTFPLYSFSQAIFPRLSRIFHKNRMKAFLLMKRIQLITTLISLICLPLIFFFARPLTEIACGRADDETVLSLRLLLIAVFFVAANAFRIQFLLVCGRTGLYSRIHVTTALFGLPLIFLLINAFSYTGAALATVIIEIVIFAATYFYVENLRFSRTAPDA
ncbi:MAG: flippase [Candidatus Omnitrophota bacterium]|jgi:PST family polysaccharide transporter|nr:flippase [Candidatus Omnitrophota bacterium]